MTMQASDTVIYKRKKYTLIDVEKGKQMIDCAEFPGSGEIYAFSFACWRGYTAEYRIRDGKLYGVRCEEKMEMETSLQSQEMFVNYTGSCVIAWNRDKDAWGNSDFLECYLDYDEALELHFTDGVLDEVRDLAEAIQEQKEWKKKVENGDEQAKIRLSLVGREELARRYLKYEYDESSYMWR